MLSCIIYLSVDYLQWQPIKLSKSVPLLSHLFFADDIILLAKVSTKSCHANIDTLNHFTNYSGQKINFQKSKNLFLKNCSQANKIFILDSFQMSEGTTFGKYLGFPMFNSNPKHTDFQFLLDNFKRRLDGLKTNFMTMAGHTTLIKSTLNAIPNPVMQYIAIPQSIINKMKQYQRNFLWKYHNQEKIASP